jgi:hypothetical protein
MSAGRVVRLNTETFNGDRFLKDKYHRLISSSSSFVDVELSIECCKFCSFIDLTAIVVERRCGALVLEEKTFSTKMERDAALSSWVARLTAKRKHRARMRASRQAWQNPLKAGDVLRATAHSSDDVVFYLVREVLGVRVALQVARRETRLSTDVTGQAALDRCAVAHVLPDLATQVRWHRAERGADGVVVRVAGKRAVRYYPPTSIST